MANSGKGREFSFEGWVNVYRSYGGGECIADMHLSKKFADGLAQAEAAHSSTRIACVRVLIEGREGDGLKK